MYLFGDVPGIPKKVIFMGGDPIKVIFMEGDPLIPDAQDGSPPLRVPFWGCPGHAQKGTFYVGDLIFFIAQGESPILGVAPIGPSKNTMSFRGLEK